MDCSTSPVESCQTSETQNISARYQEIEDLFKRVVESRLPDAAELTEQFARLRIWADQLSDIPLQLRAILYLQRIPVWEMDLVMTVIYQIRSNESLERSRVVGSCLTKRSRASSSGYGHS